MIYDTFTFNFFRWTTATLVRRKGNDRFVALVKSKNQGMRLRGAPPSDKQFDAYLAQNGLCVNGKSFAGKSKITQTALEGMRW